MAVTNLNLTSNDFDRLGITSGVICIIYSISAATLQNILRKKGYLYNN
jgi:hypothetical protein